MAERPDLQRRRSGPATGSSGREQQVVRAGVCPTGCAAADVFRPALVSLEYTYWNGFVSDTITTNNLTVNSRRAL